MAIQANTWVVPQLKNTDVDIFPSRGYRDGSPSYTYHKGTVLPSGLQALVNVSISLEIVGNGSGGDYVFSVGLTDNTWNYTSLDDEIPNPGVIQRYKIIAGRGGSVPNSYQLDFKCIVKEGQKISIYWSTTSNPGKVNWSASVSGYVMPLNITTP